MSAPVLRDRFTIKNRLGLHARAAALIVQTASRYDAELTLMREGQRVNGRSIMELMMLEATEGSVIEVTASGPEAAEALAAIGDLIERRFDEDE